MNLRPGGPRLRRLLPIAIAAVIGVGAGAGAYALTTNGSGTPATSNVVVPAQPASSTSTVDSLAQLYKQDAPGVVDITVQSSSGTGSSGGFPFGSPGGSQKQEAEGTGFEIDTKSNIPTPEHGGDRADSIKGEFPGRSTAKGTRVRGDKTTQPAP